MVYGTPKITNPENVTVGNNVNINDGAIINATESQVFIGDNVTVSNNAMLLAASYDPQRFLYYGDRTHINNSITVGDNCWICAGAIILPGISICNNVIIAAGTVLTKDVNTPFSIWGGNPARVLKIIDNNE